MEKIAIDAWRASVAVRGAYCAAYLQAAFWQHWFDHLLFWTSGGVTG
jgi:hypothetical protein